MAGLIFYQGPVTNSGSNKNELGGNGDVIYEGTMYFPDQDIEIKGGPTQTQWAPCTAMVARSIEIKDNSVYNIGSDFAACNVPAFPSLSVLRVALFE